jgi:hypothetical protein
MAKNERKRQQKLAKKQKRAKELKKQRNVALNISTRDLIRSAAERGSWVGCYHHFSQGMHQVFAVRQTRAGVCASIFLVDSYCLGIKDTFFIKSFDMDVVRDRMAEDELKQVTPAYALKFLQGAVAYSQGIGLPLHRDAKMCLSIFGNTDTTECSDEFVYGDAGKPHYISGPNDSLDKQKSILEILKRLGDGNFNFTFKQSAIDHNFDQFDSEEDPYDDFDDEYAEVDDDDDDSYNPSERMDSTTINAESVKQLN